MLALRCRATWLPLLGEIGRTRGGDQVTRLTVRTGRVARARSAIDALAAVVLDLSACIRTNPSPGARLARLLPFSGALLFARPPSMAALAPLAAVLCRRRAILKREEPTGHGQCGQQGQYSAAAAHRRQSTDKSVESRGIHDSPPHERAEAR